MFKPTNVMRVSDSTSEVSHPQDYLSMRKRWWQRVILFKDGAIQGWVVSFAFTVLTMIMLVLGFLVNRVADGWVKFGATYATIYLGSTGTWLGYRYFKSSAEQLDISKVTENMRVNSVANDSDRRNNEDTNK
jgi:hypothetical protein